MGGPSIISKAVEILGNIDSPGEIQLDGNIKGDVTCDSLTVGDCGSILGTIRASTVTIRGTVDGEIRGHAVRLEKTAHVTGDILHQSLSVEAGAKLSGKIVHVDNPLKEETASKADPVEQPEPQSASNEGDLRPADRQTDRQSDRQTDRSGRQKDPVYPDGRPLGAGLYGRSAGSGPAGSAPSGADGPSREKQRTS
ncbi:bactofilin family protein [Iodidimonas nitroreducens]|uniref:bactofilin family protein n=1 Tax=Iodidimonas nitroreducens TaxID=1236968 RepID=UPI00123049D8|nr:polymer-forming cytoskeletal protein [Iodidimonas nitroreducens]